MKKKIGTVLEKEIFVKAKHRAIHDGKTLAEVIEEALTYYLNEAPKESLRAAEKFCSHRTSLSWEEVEEVVSP